MINIDVITVFVRLIYEEYIYAIVYWTMIIILYLVCVFLTCPLSLFSHKFRISDMLSILSQCFRSSQRITKRSIFNLDQNKYMKMYNSCYI